MAKGKKNKPSVSQMTDSHTFKTDTKLDSNIGVTVGTRIGTKIGTGIGIKIGTTDSIKIGSVTKINTTSISKISTSSAITSIGTDIKIASAIAKNIRFFLPSVQRESLPIVPNSGAIFRDTLDVNKNWWLPDYQIKPVTEGGMAFVCEETGGVDSDGNKAYRGELKLVFRQKTTIPALPNIRVERVSLELTRGILSFNRNGNPIGINGTAQFSVDFSEITLTFGLMSDMVKSVYGVLSKDLDFSIAVEARYKAATPSGISTPVHLLNHASQGRWMGGQLVDNDNTINNAWLPFNGSDGDSRGFVRMNNVIMEDGTVQFALRTHPMWVNNGTIKGWLPWVTLPLKAVFRTKIGFLGGATGSDGATFQVWEHHIENGREVWNKVLNHRKTYTGKMVEIAADLSHLAGQNVGIELRVDTGVSSGQDWAAWVNPVIEGDPYKSLIQTVRIGKVERSGAIKDVSFNCQIQIDRYQLRQSNGVLQPFGCVPPWIVGNVNTPQYQRYNKVSNATLAACGVKAVYLSNFIEREFLVIPERYAICLNPDRQAEAFLSLGVNPDNSTNDTIVFDFKVAPVITDFNYLQLKKALVQSWTVEGDNLMDSIKIDFPRQAKTENFALGLAPNSRILEGQLSPDGRGHQFHVQLGGVRLTNAQLLIDAIQSTNALGQPFSVILEVDSGETTPVETLVNLSLRELAGTHVICAKNLADNKVILMGTVPFTVRTNAFLAEESGKTNNSLVEFTQAVAVNNETITLSQTAAQTVLAARWETPLSSGMSLREKNITTDNIAVNLAFSTTSTTFSQGVARVEGRFTPLNGNMMPATLHMAASAVLVPLRFPLTSYLGERTVAYDVIFYDANHIIVKRETGTLNLAITAALNVSLNVI